MPFVITGIASTSSKSKYNMNVMIRPYRDLPYTRVKALYTPQSVVWSGQPSTRTMMNGRHV